MAYRRTWWAPGSNGDSTENRGISFWRAWTVNYGRYCPPANNRPPHYMWELLTADRLGGSLSALRESHLPSSSVASTLPRSLPLAFWPGFVPYFPPNICSIHTHTHTHIRSYPSFLNCIFSKLRLERFARPNSLDRRRRSLPRCFSRRFYSKGPHSRREYGQFQVIDDAARDSDTGQGLFYAERTLSKDSIKG